MKLGGNSIVHAIPSSLTYSPSSLDFSLPSQTAVCVEIIEALLTDTLMSTYLPKPGEIEGKWHTIDATGQVLGRLAAKVAMILQGKTKPTYSPNVDTGDFVIILNADKIRVTGKKAEVIEYDTYSRYPGGRKLYSYKRMNELHPERVVQLAVKRMLPKNKLGRHQLTKLRIFTGTEHPHSAQQPQKLELAK